MRQHPSTQAGPTVAANAPMPNRPRGPVHDPLVGSTLGKYRITGRLGEGGMGIVYEALDTLLQRKVAIKLLPLAVSSDPEVLRRFQMEAQAAALLDHPNVVGIYEVDQREETHYIVMELVCGGSAEDLLLKHGPYPWQEATSVIADACRGLAAAHAANIVHRDIKPANIMRSTDGKVVKLADFGLAKAVNHTTQSITVTGTAVGTPNFMSPEQCRAERLDNRSDIYSLGATYFMLLTGRPPYSAESHFAVMFAHCSNPVPDPRRTNAAIPDDCAAIVQRAMAKEPSDRYQSATDMLSDLSAVLAAPRGNILSAALACHPAQARPMPSLIGTTLDLPPVAPELGKRPQYWLPYGVAAIMVGVLVQALLVFQLFSPSNSGEQTEEVEAGTDTGRVVAPVEPGNNELP